MESVATMPKVIGKVDLSQFEKKVKKLEYKQFGSFPVSLYSKATTLAKEASKKIGILNAITVSNKSKIKVRKSDNKFVYEEVPDKGSIWYACDIELLKKHFIQPLRILEMATNRHIRKLNSGEFRHLPFDKEFYFMYVSDKGKIDIIKNIRVNGGEYEKEGVCYRGENQGTVYCLEFSAIGSDSTFNTGVKGETGLIFISTGENI